MKGNGITATTYKMNKLHFVYIALDGIAYIYLNFSKSLTYLKHTLDIIHPYTLSPSQRVFHTEAIFSPNGSFGFFFLN